MSPTDEVAVKKFALQQNITTLRNRVNALGVAEPIIQQQGERRIVVQLPGAQDPGRLKEILGATATLEYRLVDTEHSVADAEAGRVPVGSRLYKTREGGPVLLSRRVIVTGDQITDASAGFDQQSGSPAVFVSLDGSGARRMREVTTDNVGKPMAVVFIGAIGGLISSGIIGLFVGAVVLVLGYKLLLAWLGGVRRASPPDETGVNAPSEADSRRG
jgi:preprotein translocase subunit SecD